MSMLLRTWVGLSEAFGSAGALMVAIYGAVIVLLIVSIVWSTVRQVRRRWRRYRVGRELALIRQSAYREHRGIRAA
jgi:hypothetical protein